MMERDPNREPVSASLTQGYGMLAGLGIIGAAIVAIPSTLFLDPLPPAEHYLSTMAALVVGLVCIALPWERMDARWLHVVGIIATVNAAIAVALFGQAYTVFFFLIAVAVAYVTATWRVLMAHVALIGVALFGPVLWGPADPRETAQMALVTFPLLCLTTGIFAYLRQRMVADQSSYRVFAEETLSLATRIAGRPLAAGPPPSQKTDVPSWPGRLPISTRVAAVAAGVLALPLVTAGLAAAGVKVPEFASDTLGSVGVDLPNQSRETLDSAGPLISWERPETLQAKRQSQEPSAGGSKEAAERSDPTRGGGGKESPGSKAEPLSGGSADGRGVVSSVFSQEQSRDEPSGDGLGGLGEDALRDNGSGGDGLGGILDEATGGIDDILGGNREGGGGGIDDILGGNREGGGGGIDDLLGGNR